MQRNRRVVTLRRLYPSRCDTATVAGLSPTAVPGGGRGSGDWCSYYTEFFPLNWAAVAGYQAAHHALYGRYPFFARLMKNARIEDQLLVFDELWYPSG